MSFMSFLRSIGNRRTIKTSRRQAKKRRPLYVECLEARVVPAGTPILITAVTPIDGSTTATALPAVQVTYNQNVLGANSASNYRLFDSSGNTVPINSVTYTSPSGGPFVATLNYNSGQNLDVDTYTLFVRGDQIRDVGGAGQQLNRAGEVVVTNDGKGNVSTIDLRTGGTLKAMTNYPLSFTGATVPASIVFADITGDTIPDMLAINVASNRVDIFSGQFADVFNQLPDVSLTLPAASGASGLTTGDFNLDGFQDIAVVNTLLNNVSIYLSSALLTYGAAVNRTVGPSPRGIVAADFNADGNLDLAVANNGTTIDVNADQVNDYYLSVFPGTATGAFPANATNIRVGDVGAAGGGAPTPIVNPTGIATGLFGTDTKPDIAVSGRAGVMVLTNSSTGATITFTNTMVSGPDTTFVRTSLLRNLTSSTNQLDIIAGSEFNGGQLIPLQNNNSGVFAALPGINIGGIPTDIAIGDFDLDGFNDVVVILDGTPGRVVTVPNNTIAGGGLTFVAPAGVIVDASATSPITITSIGHGLATGDRVTVSGVSGNTGANGTFTVNVLSTNAFQLLGSTFDGTVYAGGGVWARVPLSVDPDPVGVAILNIDSAVGGPDIVTVSGVTTNLSVLLNNANRTFRASDEFPVDFGFSAGDVATGDLNGDGVTDIVVAQPAFNRVSVFLGLDQGGYAPVVSYSTLSIAGFGGNPVSIILADLANSGRPDIVIVSQTDSVISVLANNGSGVFSVLGTAPVGLSPVDVVSGDFNGDGRVDLAVAHIGGGLGTGPGGGGNVSILIGNGNRTFQAAAETGLGVVPSALGVGDFNKDGKLDLVVTDNNAVGRVVRLLGDGTGKFTTNGSFSVGSNPAALAVGDLNGDGYLDVITAGSSLSSDNISTLLNASGGGFANAIFTTVPSAFGIQDLALVNLDQDLFPDLIVTPLFNSGLNNVITLTANGDGSFLGPLEYAVGGGSFPNPLPSRIAIVSDPFRRVTTFTSGGNTVSVNLVRNGNFEARDLSGEQGNLTGWKTYDQPGTPGSRGRWAPQSGTLSPQSATSSPAPTGFFRAMLDQADLAPQVPFSGQGNAIDDWSGSHALYQDITIPASASRIILSFDLIALNFGSFSDTSVTPTLDFTVAVPNQQIRVDLLDPAAAPLAVNPDNPGIAPGVLQNIFLTGPGGAVSGSQTVTLDAAKFAGKTVRLRFAAANNRGALLVGVDNVNLQVRFVDTQAPLLTELRIRNPSILASASLTDPTTDPTIVGRVTENGSINNLLFIEFDTKNNGFGQFDDFKTVSVDGNGEFSFSVPTSLLLPGKTTISIRAVDRVGNQTLNPLEFVFQGPSDVNWSSQGPGPINVASAGVQYSDVSGEITAIAVDPRDASGNTYYIGAASGGVWKTTNGGSDWKVLTDAVRDASGNVIPVTVGGLALGVTPSGTALYVGTGVTNTFAAANAGVGVLKSVDDGATWTLVGQSVLKGARVSKVVVDPANANRVFVAVSSFADPTKKPGIFRSLDGGQTWTDVLNPLQMFLPGRTANLGAGAALASVTDMVLDPFTSGRLLIGLGNIGQVASSSTAGLWRSSDSGDSWEQVVGVNNTTKFPTSNNILPSGTTVGRVTIGIGGGRVGDERYVYILMGTPATTTTVVNRIENGTLLGLFKSKDNLLNFTKVMLKQNIGLRDPVTDVFEIEKYKENFVNIELFSHDASSFGAVVVDPSNPNVVYVGGSNRFAHVLAGEDDPPNHSFVRIDTGNMRDTDFFSAPGTIPNDGDDISKAFVAAHVPDPPPPTPPPVRVNGQYDPDPNATGGNTQGRAYTGEGVFWYDLQQAAAFIEGGLQLVPSNFRVLTFDKQGRLLLGTDSGIYRGTNLGFPYDLVSGGLGIVTNQGGDVTLLSSFIPGMDFVSLNGNLEITPVTGAGVDPTDSSRVYSSQLGSGTALTLGGPSNWQTSGISGPLPNSFAIASNPNATGLRVGSAVPVGTGSTFSPVFRTWQASTPLSNYPEISIDGGVTFDRGALSGIDEFEPTGLTPPLVINPNKLVVNGVAHDQLLYGTQRVFITDTSSNVWDPISPVLSPGDFVSAVAFTPTPGMYYAGTTDGRIFVQTPGANWPERSVGLPGIPGSATAPKITFIAVDPSNSNIAFALVDGVGFAHVYRTTNGGVTWIASNALAAGGSLPDFPAYTMVMDSRPVPGAANGRYYLGTSVGVYASLDKGLSWDRLGQGLPTAPVVDLQFYPQFELLVAATQGRGIFELSTRSVGPIALEVTPNTPIAQPLTQVTVTFDEDVDVRTFTVDANVAARKTLLNGLLNTNDYRVARSITLYEQYLRRTPTESVQWAADLLKVGGEEQVIAALVSSAEYFGNPALGNGNNATWVNQAYLDLLRRTSAGDQAAADAVTALNAGTQTRLQVATGLVTSAEFHADEAAALYNQILGRTKLIPASFSDPELANWIQLFGQGVRVEALMADLIGSQEYYLNNDGFYSVGAGKVPTAVAVANLSGNKDAFGTPINDLIVTFSNNTVGVFKGKVGGGYASTPALTLTLPASAAPRAIAVNDFNNDGKHDVAVVNSGTNNITVFLNSSTGGNIGFASLTGTSFAVGVNSGPVAIVAGKFNADANVDLAVVSSRAVATKFNLYILTGDGAGVFGGLTTQDTAAVVPLTGLAAGDVNGDGVQDFVVSASDGGLVATGAVRLLRATGVLTYASTSVSSVAASSVALAPIDTDASLDIVTSNTSAGTVQVLQNRGGSPVTFASAGQFVAGTLPISVAVGDLNGDGRRDIAVANAISTGGLTRLLNTTVKATAGFDTITFGAALTYPSPGGQPVGLVLADTNQDLILDAVMAAPITNAIVVQYGTTLGSFATPSDERFVAAAFRQLYRTSPSQAALQSNIASLGNMEQSRLTGPNGSTVPLSIVDVDPETHRTFTLTFAPQTTDGVYTLIIGPNTLQNNIKDFTDLTGTYANLGNPSNQNGNEINGEFAADRFTAQFAVNTSDNGRFVSGLYHDLLGYETTGRSPETQGFINFLAPLDAARLAVLAGNAPSFITSLEYRGGLVQSYYVKFLRRATAPPLSGPEVQGWVTQINVGQKTEEGIISEMVSSAEYFQNPLLGNSNNATWLEQAYLDLLGRTSVGDAAAAGFLAGLNGGTLTRLNITSTLVTGDEFLRRVIFTDFAALLGRAPHDSTDPALSEFAFWLPTLRQSSFPPGGLTPSEKVVQGLSTSLEYFQHVGNTNRDWSESMYERVLRRGTVDANGPEVSNVLNNVLNGYNGNRQGAASAVANSGEHQNRVVASYYQDFLHRTASLPETIGWVVRGLRDEQILASIVSSGEYFPLSGPGSSNAGWVAKVYNDLLKRPSAGDNGATGFINQLNALPPSQVGAGRFSVAITILSSTEYRRLVVATFFNKYLGRSKPIPPGADPELNFWVNLLASGQTQEQVAAQMMASSEYFLKAHPLP